MWDGYVGPLLSSPGKAQFVLFMTDYFSKWVEAQAYRKIMEKEVIDFIWDHIVYLFKIPYEIACDNGKQFIGSKVTKFLEGLKIKRILSTPYYPSGNGQAESTNKTIIQNLKRRLTDNENGEKSCPKSFRRFTQLRSPVPRLPRSLWFLVAKL